MRGYIRDFVDQFILVIYSYWYRPRCLEICCLCAYSHACRSPSLHISLMSLVERLAIALRDEFKAFLPQVIPFILSVFQLVSTELNFNTEYTGDYTHNTQHTDLRINSAVPCDITCNHQAWFTSIGVTWNTSRGALPLVRHASDGNPQLSHST